MDASTTDTIDTIDDAVDSKLKENLKILKNAKNEIFNELNASSSESDLSDIVARLQATLSASNGMPSSACADAFSFLHILSVPTLSIHRHLLESIRAQLIPIVDTLDQGNLLLLLKDTIAFIAISELKSIPLAIIKVLRNIPDKYLLYLGEQGSVLDLPSNARRQVWELNNNLFLSHMHEKCIKRLQGVDDTSSSSVLKDAVAGIIDGIGGSQKLLKSFGDHCCKHLYADKAANWGGILRLIIMEKKRDDVSSMVLVGKLHELSWLIDSCIRRNAIDDTTFMVLIDLISNMFQSQLLQKLGRNEAPQSCKVSIPSKYAEKRSNKSLSPVEEVIQEGIDYLLAIDPDGIFLWEVTDEVAPGYSLIVTKPMFIARMKAKLASHEYQTLAQFHADAQLMFDNCILFNGRDSYYGNLASQLRDKWGFKMVNLLARAEKIGIDTNDIFMTDIKGKKDKDVHSKRSTVKRAAKMSFVPFPASDDKRYLPDVLDHCWKFIEASDTDGVFAFPVNGSAVYHDVVRNPMDLSTMRVKIDRRKYKHINDLDNDIQLMLNNCMLFNKQGSELYNLAKFIQSHWDTYLPQVLQVLNGQLKQTSSPYSFNDAVDEVEASDSDEEWTGDRGSKLKSVAPAGPAKSSKSPPSVAEVIQEGIDYLLAIDPDGIFLWKVTDEVAPGYSLIVTKPMFIARMKAKLASHEYQTLAQFHADAQLMFDNCILFNGRDSYYGNLASQLRDKWGFKMVNLERMAAANNSIKVDNTSNSTGGNSSSSLNKRSIDSVISTASVSSSASVVLNEKRYGDDDGSDNSDDLCDTADVNGHSVTSPDTHAHTSEPEQKKQKVPEIEDGTYRYEEALNVLQDTIFSEFPCNIVAESKLSWAVCIIQDPAFQSLLYKFLSNRIRKCHLVCVSDATKTLSSHGETRTADASYKPFSLPSDDRITKLAVQLCSFTDASYRVKPLNVRYIRVYVPMFLLHLARISDAKNPTGLVSFRTREDAEKLINAIVEGSDDSEVMLNMATALFTKQ